MESPYAFTSFCWKSFSFHYIILLHNNNILQTQRRRKQISVNNELSKHIAEWHCMFKYQDEQNIYIIGF